MKIIPLSALSVPEYRTRRTFDPKGIDELARSIASHGLQNPPVARSDGNGGWLLVSGERRHRAILSLLEHSIEFSLGETPIPLGSIPITPFGDISPLHALELEVAENTIRIDLPWNEQIEAIAKLHALRKAHSPTQTITDTAREIQGDTAAGSQITRVSTAIALAPYLADPEVAAAKSVKEAEKVVRRKIVAAQRAELASRFDLTSTPHQVIHGPCETHLPLMEPGSISVFITDPPYGVGADDFGSQATTLHKYDDSPQAALARYDLFANEFARLSSPQGSHAYLFLDIRHFPQVAAMFALAGWRVWPTPLIWAKNRGMLPWPEHGPRRMYECILFAIFNDRRVNLIKSDVLPIPAESEDHGAAKPVELYKDLLSRSALPGDTVLDPCCGSGPVFPAAESMNCRAIGIEVSEEYFNISVSRISANSIDI